MGMCVLVLKEFRTLRIDLFGVCTIHGGLCLSSLTMLTVTDQTTISKIYIGQPTVRICTTDTRVKHILHGALVD